MLGLLLISSVQKIQEPFSWARVDATLVQQGCSWQNLLETGTWIEQSPLDSVAQTKPREWDGATKQVIRGQDQRQSTHPVYL